MGNQNKNIEQPFPGNHTLENFLMTDELHVVYELKVTI